MDRFQAWTGPIDVLAGPVIEVSNFGSSIEKRRIIVECWYLSSDLGGARHEATTPFGVKTLMAEVAPNDDLVESVESAEQSWPFPTSIVPTMED